MAAARAAFIWACLRPYTLAPGLLSSPDEAAASEEAPRPARQETGATLNRREATDGTSGDAPIQKEPFCFRREFCWAAVEG